MTTNVANKPPDSTNLINPPHTHTAGLFLYLLKTSENQEFSVLGGTEKMVA